MVNCSVKTKDRRGRGLTLAQADGVEGEEDMRETEDKDGKRWRP